MKKIFALSKTDKYVTSSYNLTPATELLQLNREKTPTQSKKKKKSAK